MSIAEKSWTFLTKMNSKRDSAASVEVDGKLFVAGGLNDDGALSSTEFISPEGTVSGGPDLPGAWHNHCMIKLPSGKLVILGGSPSSELGKSALEFNPANLLFRDWPALTSKRFGHCCAVFNSPLHNGRPVAL